MSSTRQPAARDALLAEAARVRPIRPARWYRQPATLLAAAAAFVALIFGARVLALQSDLARLQTDVAQVRATATQTANGLAERDQILAMLAGGGRIVTISTASYGGSVVVPSGSETPLLIAGSMPAIASNQVYQVWAISASGPRSIGVFSPGTSIVHLTGSLAGASRVAITVEPGPAGGPAPTTMPFLSGSL